VGELDAALDDWRAPAAYGDVVARALAAWEERVDASLAGEAFTQGVALRTLEAAVGEGDWVVAAAGSPPGDLLKLWRTPAGSATHIEFGFSCMGHELPAALGIRLAQPGRGRVVAVIGDGTYLMAPTELLTAAQESLDVTVVVLVNGGYQSIHGLQRASVAHGYGNEFAVEADIAASARAFGATAWDVDTAAGLADALREARGPTVIACHVVPSRLPDSGAWWDLGVPEVSSDAAVREAAARQRAGAADQRWYG
jgi:3D-(3,5/4)-trihydroxycyclohexane-1,2-dione acylhydrolase (decyclizing)